MRGVGKYNENLQERGMRSNLIPSLGAAAARRWVPVRREGGRNTDGTRVEEEEVFYRRVESGPPADAHDSRERRERGKGREVKGERHSSELDEQ